MIHYNFVVPQAAHQWCFVSTTDPALVTSNQVSAGKGWYNPTDKRLRYRNAANTDWALLGGLNL